MRGFSMKSGTLCLLFLLALSFETGVFGQDKKPPKSEEDEVVRVDTELVEVPVVVTDRTGKPMLNLKQSNFTVYEDGRTQELTDFAATNAPFEVDRKSTRLNSSHGYISYAVFCLKKK